MSLKSDDFRQSLGQALRSTQALCLMVATVLTLVGMPWWIALVYSLCIGNLTSLLIHLGRWGLTWRQVRRGGLDATLAQRHGWPGWGPMSGVVVLSVLVAYPLGSAIAGALTGTASEMHQHPWRTWVALFAVSLVPAAVGTVYFRAKAQVSAAETELAEVARHAAETELRLLQSQLEPHMLFNTLANLRALIGLDPAAAQAMLDHMIAWLRSTLSASRRERHPLHDEFRHAEDYLALMKVRMGDRLQTGLDLPRPLADLPVPPLLLQPLVENAIRHGLEPLRGPARLELHARQEGDQLCLEVLDNGIGLEAARGSAGTGFGLTQVRERLATLHGPHASLELLPHPEGGTLARVRLPWSPANR